MSLDSLDLSTFRSPIEHLAWFETIQASVDTDPTNKKAALLHEGYYKFFYEELFPLAYLLSAKKTEWEDASFRHLKGSQNFDVEIKDHPLRYIEIVTTDFDDAERFRMQRYLANGHVDILNPVERNKRNRPSTIKNEGDMRAHQELVEEELYKIKARVLAKSEKKYPERTGLLVYYNDCKCYPKETDRPVFEALINELQPEWSQTFDAIFIVGAKADYTFERSAQTTSIHG